MLPIFFWLISHSFVSGPYSGPITLPQGPENWSMHVIDGTSQGADGARLIDATGDGLPDIVTPWEEGGAVRLYVHPGPEAVRDPWPFVSLGAVDNVEDALPIDLDGDGRIEVVSAAEGDTRKLSVHTFSRTATDLLDPDEWSTETVSGSLDRMQWMFSAEGPEGMLLSGGKNDGAEVGYFDTSAGGPSAWRWQSLGRAGWIMSLEAQDMDMDGDLDVLLSDRRGESRGIRWFENVAGQGQGAWPLHPVGGQDLEVMFIDYHDIDGDGLDDIAAATSGGPVLLFRRLDRSGRRWDRHELVVPSPAGTGKSVAVGDLDLDGRMDIALSTENAAKRPGLLQFSHSGDPWTTNWHVRDIGGHVGTKFDLLTLFDMDADGDPDLITCEETENLGVIWYENPVQ